MKILLNSGTLLKNQIAEQLRSEISSGKIGAGQQLPSVRSLAKDLKISIITTVKAYELLEQGRIRDVHSRAWIHSYKPGINISAAKLLSQTTKPCVNFVKYRIPNNAIRVVKRY